MNRSSRSIVGFVLSSILLLAGCGESPAHIDYHSSGLKNVASLDVYVDGKTIHLLLAGRATEGKTPVLRYTRSNDSGATWRAPVRVQTDGSTPYDPHRGDDVQLAAVGVRLVALWLTEGTGYGGSGPLATAVSSDGGETWTSGPNPADNDSTKGHGFADLVASGDGNFHLVWLDGRGGEQALYYARGMDGGRHWSRNEPIDTATCECCWNTLKASSDGELFVLYRNIDPRDMALAATSSGNTWQRLGSVGDFDWNFDGCPHTGGGLAIAPGAARLHAVVWTGQGESVGLHHLTSTDGGRGWSSPRRLGGYDAHHADIAARDADRVAAVWDTIGSRGGAIVAALSDDGGRTWEQRTVHQSNTSPSQPRVIATPRGWRVFWTERRGGVGVWAMTGL